MCSCSGSCNCNSTTIPRGPQGAPGQNGAAATIAVGNVTALPAGATPTVSNGGSSSAASFNFGIPAGATGGNGDNGLNAFTTLTALFVQPLPNSTEQINVVNTSWMAVDQIIFIGDSPIFTDPGGFYKVTSVLTLTSMVVMRMNWTIPGVTFRATGTAVGSAGTIVTPSGTIGPEGIIKKILDETSEDAESDTSGPSINNHSWTILDLTNNQDTISFDFIIGSKSGNGNFSGVSILIGGTTVSRFTDSDATIAAQIKYNTDPTDVPAGYISSSDPLLSEDINFIKGVVKITRTDDTRIGYDIIYYMYNNIIQSSYSNTTSTRMVQKIFNTVGGALVPSIDTSGLNFGFSVTPNFMSGGATFGTAIQIYNAIKLSSIL